MTKSFFVMVWSSTCVFQNLIIDIFSFQVVIRYGKFPNATLMLDFGFTLPYNIRDQVKPSIPEPVFVACISRTDKIKFTFGLSCSYAIPYIDYVPV